MLTIPAPAELHGGVLAEDVVALGAPPFYVEGSALAFPTLGESDAAAVQAALVGHSDRARARNAADAQINTNETSIRDKAAQALSANANDITTNDGYLAITSPTNAQVAAQVKELTRQSTRQAREINALIRLTLRRFEAAE